PSAPLVAPLGSSVVLLCYVDELLLMEDLKVEWRRTDSEALVHLFLDGESRPEAQQQEYHDRAHFFTDQIQRGNFSLLLDNLRAEDEGRYTCRIPKGNFSLRLKSVRTEDKGVYMCLVFAGDLSANATVVLEQFGENGIIQVIPCQFNQIPPAQMFVLQSL
uniref:Ig-like domain-containing protein n=1 Tax=Sinocyclocheilus grahami TaxID=75366 RepID=A0A672LDS5_SINGR